MLSRLNIRIEAFLFISGGTQTVSAGDTFRVNHSITETATAYKVDLTIEMCGIDSVGCNAYQIFNQTAIKQAQAGECGGSSGRRRRRKRSTQE